jgi:hypothetical protein
MAAKKAPVGPPSPETREQLWQLIRSTTEPLTAKALARRLLPPHRIGVAQLVPLLDEQVAAGGLFRIPPATAKGSSRFWDRDLSAVLRTAAVDLVRRTERPLTPRELLGGLGLPFKVTEPELTAILKAMVDSRDVFTIPAMTAKGKPRFWRHDALEFGRQELVKQLETRGAQPAAALRKSLKGFGESQFQQILSGALAAHLLWRHPPLGKSKHELIGKAPPSPEPYLRDVGQQLAQVVSRLQAAEIPREALRRAVLQMVEAAGVEFTPGTLAVPGARILPAHPPVDLIRMMRRIEPGADRGALIGARDLRREAQLEKQHFDQAVLELARQGKVSLHRHDYPTGLTESEREDLVYDGAGNYYVGVALRL